MQANERLELGKKRRARLTSGPPQQQVNTALRSVRRATGRHSGVVHSSPRPLTPSRTEGNELAYGGLGSDRRNVNPTVFYVLRVAHLPRGRLVFGCVPDAVAAGRPRPPELLVVELKDAIEVHRREAPGRDAHLTLPLDGSEDEDLGPESRLGAGRVDRLTPGRARGERKVEKLDRLGKAPRVLLLERADHEPPLCVDFLGPFRGRALGVRIDEPERCDAVVDRGNFRVEHRYRAATQVVDDPVLPVVSDGELRGGHRGACDAAARAACTPATGG